MRCSSPTGLLLPVAMALLAGPHLPAAVPPDREIELLETTYRIAADNSAEITVHQRVKALTAQGRTAVSRMQVAYGAAFEDVEVKSIRTIKKDGSTVDGDPASAFDTNPASNPMAPTYSDFKWKTLLAPNVETGDTVEFEVLRRMHRWPKPGEFWLLHRLTATVPVLSEAVVLEYPAGRPVAFFESTAVSGKTEIANGRRIERWTTSSPEPARISLDTEPLFAVSSIRTWDGFAEWIRSLNREAATPTPEIQALAAKLTTNKSGERERIAALYSYVATKVRYTGISFGIGRIQPHAAGVVLHNAFGDCKDQAALLSALLTAAGFHTYAVLTTPGIGVALREVPTPEQFNHEFTAIDTQSGLLFLDTSMGPVQPGVLAPGVRGRSAFLVGPQSSSIVEIPLASPAPMRMSESLKGKITAAGVFDGSVRIEIQGVVETAVRRVFLDATEVEKEKLVRQLSGPWFRNANPRQISSFDPADLTQPFWVQWEIGDSGFFPPSKTSLPLTLEKPNALVALLQSAKKPAKPVPMEPVAVERTIDLKVDPSLTVVDSMPVHLKTAFGGFDAESTFQDGHLVMKQSFAIAGGSIAPADWVAFVKFLGSATTEVTRGFTLERHSVSIPADASPLTMLFQEGAAANRRHDYQGAKRAFLEVTKLSPKSATAWNDLGRAYYDLHEYVLAEEAYKRQIEIDPRDPHAYLNLGVLYRALKRDDEAIEWFRKQIAITPRDIGAHDSLAAVLVAKRQWEQARQESAIAIELAPEDAAKWARLGRTQVQSGHPDEARKSFDRALELVHDAMTENNVAYYMSEGGIDLDKAWRLVSGALDPEARRVCEPDAVSKDDPCTAPLRRIATMLDTAGWILYRQGRFSEAEPYVTSAYAINPHTELELHLSAIAAKLGHLDEALAYFAAARSRADLARFDTAALTGELAKAVGGQAQLDSRLERSRPPAASAPGATRVLALVDGNGKVLEAQAADPKSPDGPLAAARSLTLAPISWPGHSLRTLRAIEFRQAGEKWSVSRSYVGLTSPVER